MSNYDRQLLIRFRGIVTNLNLPKEMKRALLLRHRDTSAPIEPHIPYIEFLADDLKSAPGLTLVYYSRPGTDGRYARIDLPDEDPKVMTEIKLKQAAPGVVTEEANYRNDVTHFGTLLKNYGQLTIAKALLNPLAANVDVSRAAAVFDMPEGKLMAGEPEASITRFDSELVNFTQRRLPRWVDLLAEVPAGELQLDLVQQPGGKVRTVKFKDTLRMITIGNEPERLILGVIGGNGGHAAAGLSHGNGNGNGNGNGGRTQPSGHFRIHYNVFDPIPEQKPVPIPTQLEGGGCGSNNVP